MKSIFLTTVVSAVTIMAAQAQEVGKPAPEFSGKSATGETISLSDLKGKTVVLEWVNFQCPFVQKHYTSGNTPKLQAMAAEKGVVWLSVNSSASGNQGFLEAAPLAAKVTEMGGKPTHTILDTDGKIGRAYDAKVTPHVFIVDAKGTLVYNGAMDSKGTTEAADIATAEPLFSNALTAIVEGKAVENSKNQPYGCSVKY